MEDVRRANGLSASRLMRLLAESTPMTAPSPSTTGRWFTPASIIAMLASDAKRVGAHRVHRRGS